MNYSTTYSSPIGKIFIESTDAGIKKLTFVDDNWPESDHPEKLVACINQLDEYFAGTRNSFNLNVDLTDLPPFHQEVLRVVMTIPHGKTRSYEQIACFLGNPKLARAVGQANSKNPIAIIIPCHRVLGKKGDLTGYAHGLTIKMKLLQLENPKSYLPQIKLFQEAPVI